MFQTAFGAHNIDGVFWTLWEALCFYLLVGLLMLVGITRQRILAFAALWPIVGPSSSRRRSRCWTSSWSRTTPPSWRAAC
jgi:hypothetical protein